MILIKPMRASPVTIIIIYSLQCTLLLRKRATGCPRVARTIRAAGAAASPTAPVAPAPLLFSLSLKRSACGEELNNCCSSDTRELLSLQTHQRLTNKSWMAKRNDVADVRFPQAVAPEIAPGLADVQQGEPAAQPPAQAEGPAGELEVI